MSNMESSMTMRNLLLTSAIAAGALGAASANAQEITALGWGGAYTQSQVEAYHKPFTAETGIRVNSVDADNPAVPIKAQVEANNVSVDAALVEYADAVRLCDEGLLEEIDLALLTPAPDGTPAEEDFLEGTTFDCYVSTDVFSTVYAYNSDTFADNPPTTIADFFDTETFPGKRGVRRNPKATLEMALMGDGVPAEEVYAMLETDEGVERALAKLDTIKDDIVWWEAGAQPPQLLADGEVAMSIAWNGRIFNAAIAEDQPFEIVWDGQVYEFEGWVIPKGAPNLEAALDFVVFSTSTEPLARAAEWISYGPPRKSSAGLVGVYQGDGETEMSPHLPTSEANLQNALASSYEFWADRDTELNERFNAWLAAS
jgi:putative spermidine/putrescine transport system substrate-binding protein